MKNYLPILLVLLVFLAGCEKELPFKDEVTKSKLVLNSIVSSDSVWTVHVSRSLSVLDSGQLDAVSDATVNIFDDSDNLVTNLTFRGQGLYESDSAKPQPGQSYRIEATAPGYDPVSVVEAIPEAVDVIGVDVVRTYNADSTVNMAMEITFADPAGQANFYRFEMEMDLTIHIAQDTQRLVFPLEMTCTDPNIEPEGGVDGVYDYLLLRDANFDGQNYALKFSTIGTFSDQYVTAVARLTLISRSEAYYNYRRSVQSYLETAGNPFAQPVQVYSNVVGGFGIFAGSTRSVLEIAL